MAFSHYHDYIATLLPDADECQSFFDYLQQPLPKSINLVTSRLPSTEQRQQYLRSNGREMTAPQIDIIRQMQDTWYVDREDRTIPLGKTIAHLAGWMYMQEVAAGLPPRVLDLPANGLVLDMCAAPGGKSIQLADRLRLLGAEQGTAPGLVRSNDINAKRLRALGTNILRTGMHNIAITKMDATAFGNRYPGLFDAILLDAPCSGEGTGFKSDNAYQRRKEEEIMRIARLQQHLLTAALKACRIGGNIIYSTCTINTYENEGVIDAIRREYGDIVRIDQREMGGLNPGFADYPCARCRPHIQRTGGFFVTKITKMDGISSGSASKLERGQKNRTDNHQRRDNGHHRQNLNLVRNMLRDQRGYEWTDRDEQDVVIISTGKKLIATTRRRVELSQSTPVWRDSVGIPIAKVVRDGCVPLHGRGQLRGTDATQRVVDLTTEQMRSYSHHQDVEMTEQQLTTLDAGSDRQYLLLRYAGVGVSVAKRMGTSLKNKFVAW